MLPPGLIASATGSLDRKKIEVAIATKVPRPTRAQYSGDRPWDTASLHISKVLQFLIDIENPRE
jgi:hypothetical protein